MATDDRPVEWYLRRAEAAAPEELAVPGPGDWGRLSRDAFIANRGLSARTVRSMGNLRLHGAGVQLHSADLSAVGAIATAWQRAVSATGAAIEQITSLRGTLPADIVQRTALVLNASPQPGSVVLHVEPKASPLPEAEPDGNVALLEPPRPLADRASERLIRILGRAGVASMNETDDLSDELREMGPRVGSTLSALADVLDKANFTLDARWAEPGTPSVVASVTPSTAKWIRRFVAGRGLDAEERTVRGVLRTVSDRERWLVGVGDDELKMSATELDSSVATRWPVGSEVTLRVRVTETQRPDGRVSRAFTILAVSEPDEEAGEAFLLDLDEED